jgi:hypothetical protein
MRNDTNQMLVRLQAAVLFIIRIHAHHREMTIDQLEYCNAAVVNGTTPSNDKNFMIMLQ